MAYGQIRIVDLTEQKVVVLYDMVLSCPPLFNFTFKLSTPKADLHKFRTFQIQITDSTQTYNFYITHIFYTPKILLPLIHSLSRNVPFINNVSDIKSLKQQRSMEDQKNSLKSLLTSSSYFKTFVLRVLPLCLVSLCVFSVLFFISNQLFSAKNNKILVFNPYNNSENTSNPEINDLINKESNNKENNKILSKTNQCKEYFKISNHLSKSKSESTCSGKCENYMLGGNITIVLYVVLKLLSNLTCTLSFFLLLVHSALILRHRNTSVQTWFVENINKFNHTETSSSNLEYRRCSDNICSNEEINHQFKFSEQMYLKNKVDNKNVHIDKLSKKNGLKNGLRERNCRNSCLKGYNYDNNFVTRQTTKHTLINGRQRTSGIENKEVLKLSGKQKSIEKTSEKLACHNYLNQLIRFVRRRTVGVSALVAREERQNGEILTFFNENVFFPMEYFNNKHKTKFIYENIKYDIKTALEAVLNVFLNQNKMLQNKVTNRRSMFSSKINSNLWLDKNKHIERNDDGKVLSSYLDEFDTRINNLESNRLQRNLFKK